MLKRDSIMREAEQPVAAPRPGRPAGAGRRRHAVSPGAVAVAWALHHPAVACAITGFRHPGQVDSIVAAAGLALTETDINDIETASEE